MKPAAAQHVPGNTESERMDNALRKVLTVSKEALLKEEEKEEEKWRRARARQKMAKKPS